jgi:carboxymethylenebutenolidase
MTMFRTLSSAPRVLPVAAALVLALAAWAPTTASAQDTSAASTDGWLPPSAEGALEALNASPRHGEWMMVRLANGDSVRSWIVYPERSDAAPVLVVIHEIYGLTNWVRAVADQAAAAGYIAVAPDLLTMEDVPVDAAGDPEQQPAVEAIRGLDTDEVHRQIRAVAEHAMALPAARSEYAITGFCWGGSATFEHATRYDDLMAAVVFYGGSPSEEALARVSVPVTGHYGGDDERVNASLPRAHEALGDAFIANIHPGAGHGFMRQQDGRDGANLRAARKGWGMLLGFLDGVRLEAAAP